MLTKINRKVTRMKITGRKYSPEILIVLGAVGSITGTVLACIATTKIKEVKEQKEAALDEIHEIYDESTDLEIMKKEATAVYARTGLKYVALYSPAVIVGGISISCMIASNVIMRKRIIGVTAAYATLATSFKNYKEEVVHRYGEDVEYKISHGIRDEEIEKTIVDKHGNEKVKKEKVTTFDPGKLGPYSRIYDETCDGWSKDPMANRTFLGCQQTAAKQRLQAQGYLTLNELYDMLGFQRIPEGQVVGWHWEKDGDNYIDFGLDTSSEATRRFINGLEPSVILDFNVQGDILEFI